MKLRKVLKSTALLTISSLTLCSSLYAKSYGEVYPVKPSEPTMTEEYTYEENIQNDSTSKQTTFHNKHYKGFKYNVHSKINNTILELADKLLLSSRIDSEDLGELAITSFVDLHKLNKTTHFGRTLSESMFDELFIRGFNVSEFRGQESLSINKKGEYFITRDIKLLNKTIPNKYILIGTYTTLEDQMLINARILNNTTGKIVASARAYYKSDDCKLLENCPAPRKIKIRKHTYNETVANVNQRRTIKISSTGKKRNLSKSEKTTKQMLLSRR